MKIFCLCLLAAALLLPARAADHAEAQAAAQAMVENEKKFYEMGQAEGTRAAFLNFLADDGLVFRPGPVKGKEVWEKRPAQGISLTWRPVFAAMAASGDLGFTTGPSEWRKQKEDEKPAGYGQFVSIWRKQKDGAWKVALDTGIETPGAAREEKTEVDYSLGETPPPAREAKAASRMLRNAEGKFANVARFDSTAAVLGSAREDIHVLREAVFPAVGRGAAGLMLSVRGELKQEKLGGGMSAAGDFAYSYGTYTFTRATKTERGHYLQIWRAEPDGTFKLALDYQTPLPPEEKK